MSEKDDFEAKKRERDSDADDELDEEDDEVESEREAAPLPKKTAPARATKSAKAAPAAAATVPSSRVGVFVVLALLAGAGAGWFGHIQQAKAAASKVDAAAPVGSNAAASGPCGAWQDKICSGSGKESAACMQAKGAAELLTPSTCTAGLQAMPATLSRIKAARASCDKLVAKLCGDLEPGSRTCTMVKERTPQFPPQRCDEMMSHYDEVIGQLKQMDAQGGPQMGGPPGDPGHGGPGHPPH
ncbi:MAG: hypothetical protein EOO73_01755 [Myxococcales bacterium]|nr:MAG: hypothetical protein EOO73_01755 [Myxococcales bacterium]